MNKNASCYNQRFGHDFPFVGVECLQCGVSQKDLSKTPYDIILDKEKESIGIDRFEKPNHRLHSPLHGVIDEIRKEYGEENIKKGVGSFGFYLGLLRNVPTHLIWQWRSEIRQSEAVGDLGKLFSWKVKRWRISARNRQQ